MGELQIRIEFCVFGGKYYYQAYDCNYRKTGWSLIVTISTLSCKVGRVMSAGFGGNAGGVKTKKHAMGSKQGSKYCFSNVLKYHYDENDWITIKPQTKSQYVLTAGVVIW